MLARLPPNWSRIVHSIAMPEEILPNLSGDDRPSWYHDRCRFWSEALIRFQTSPTTQSPAQFDLLTCWCFAGIN